MKEMPSPAKVERALLILGRASFPYRFRRPIQVIVADNDLVNEPTVGLLEGYDGRAWRLTTGKAVPSHCRVHLYDARLLDDLMALAQQQEAVYETLYEILRRHPPLVL